MESTKILNEANNPFNNTPIIGTYTLDSFRIIPKIPYITSTIPGKTSKVRLKILSALGVSPKDQIQAKSKG